MAKESFCLILWKASGGLIGADGAPTGPAVAGLCKAPEDCATCDFMLAELGRREPGTNYLWVCPDCIDQALIQSKELHISVQVPGYYTSGLCQRPHCQRDTEYRYSSLLQLLVVTGDQIP